MTTKAANKIAFLCPCPGCESKAEAKLDAKGRIYLICSICPGRIFGPRMIAKYLSRIGGTMVAELRSMSFIEVQNWIDEWG